ncbi:hypothetical protein [uncultured Tateyamaria sp.]|uniref:hypothetical protein n=1 Tax=uncultured Tateyamaria sp. TaxID=455651 RepID=UPI00261FE1C8|nr:hypothetical protein [uncultured Tateyamaria sp.]
MGIRTTLYSVSREMALALINDGDPGFEADAQLDLDKSAPVLGHLIGADPGRRGLYTSDCIEIADAALRGFLPEDVAMLLRRMKDVPVMERLASADWDAEIAGKIYPFETGTNPSDGAQYIQQFVQGFEDFVAGLVDQERGMITVEI